MVSFAVWQSSKIPMLWSLGTVEERLNYFDIPEYTFELRIRVIMII